MNPVLYHLREYMLQSTSSFHLQPFNQFNIDAKHLETLDVCISILTKIEDFPSEEQDSIVREIKAKCRQIELKIKNQQSGLIFEKFLGVVGVETALNKCNDRIKSVEKLLGSISGINILNLDCLELIFKKLHLFERIKFRSVSKLFYRAGSELIFQKALSYGYREKDKSVGSCIYLNKVYVILDYIIDRKMVLFEKEQVPENLSGLQKVDFCLKNIFRRQVQNIQILSILENRELYEMEEREVLENFLLRIVHKKKFVICNLEQEDRIASVNALWYGIFYNRSKILKILIELGINIDRTGINKNSHLHLSAYEGNYNQVKLLVKNGACVNRMNLFKETPLHKAVLSENKKVVKYLLKNNAKVNVRDIKNQTPLHKAAINGSFQLVDCLLKYKSKLDPRDVEGQTPLHHAVSNGHLEIVIYLICAGADCKAVDKFQTSPLHLCALRGLFDIAEFLMNHGAEIEAVDKDNDTPLHISTMCGFSKIVNSLLSRGANLEATSKKGLTPLHVAILAGQYEIFWMLIEKGADLTKVDLLGNTPLHLAAFCNQAKMVKDLVAKDFSLIDKVNSEGFTPLRVSVSRQHGEVAQLLLEQGADLKGFRKSDLKTIFKLIET